MTQPQLAAVIDELFIEADLTSTVERTPTGEVVSLAKPGRLSVIDARVQRPIYGTPSTVMERVHQLRKLGIRAHFWV